jgi:hypothetical protein
MPDARQVPLKGQQSEIVWSGVEGCQVGSSLRGGQVRAPVSPC